MCVSLSSPCPGSPINGSPFSTPKKLKYNKILGERVDSLTQDVFYNQVKNNQDLESGIPFTLSYSSITPVEDGFVTLTKTVDEENEGLGLRLTPKSVGKKRIFFNEDYKENSSETSVVSPSKERYSTPKKSEESKSPFIRFTPEPKGRKMTRQVLHVNRAASRSESANDFEDVSNHGYQRILHIVNVLQAYSGKGLRTGKKPRYTKVWVGHAPMQVGKSSVKGSEAAHPYLGSGTLEYERDGILREIVKEGLTPNKEKLLRWRGISDHNLNDLQLHHSDVVKVKKIIKEIWPRQGLLSGTRLEVMINSTNVHDSQLNQIVDRQMEWKTRSLLATLIWQIRRNEITPEEATKKIVKAIRSHFEGFIIKIECAIGKLEKFRMLSSEIITIEDKYLQNDVVDELMSLRYQSAIGELRKTWSEFTGITRGWRRLSKMKQNIRYFCKKSYSDAVQRIEKVACRRKHYRIEVLQSEAEQLNRDLHKLIDYTRWELEGTIEPPYEFYTKTYSPNSKTWRKKTPEEEDKTNSIYFGAPSPHKRCRRKKDS